MLLYRWRDLDAGLRQVADLIDDSEAAWRLATSGQRRVQKAHRFDQRVEGVIDAAQRVRARRPDLFAPLAALAVS